MIINNQVCLFRSFVSSHEPQNNETNDSIGKKIGDEDADSFAVRSGNVIKSQNFIAGTGGCESGILGERDITEFSIHLGSKRPSDIGYFLKPN